MWKRVHMCKIMITTFFMPFCNQNGIFRFFENRRPEKSKVKNRFFSIFFKCDLKSSKHENMLVECFFGSKGHIFVKKSSSRPTPANLWKIDFYPQTWFFAIFGVPQSVGANCRKSSKNHKIAKNGFFGSFRCVFIPLMMIFDD